MRRLSRSNGLRLAAFAPIVVAYTLVEITEPFPHGWLAHTNPHFWPNLLRAFAFVFGGVVLGMIAYTLLRSIVAEATVSGGHPRRLLYQHVMLISVSHGLLIATLLFYVRERINDPLSPATPIGLVGLIGTFAGLALMLGYQNSRLRRVHAAKQIIGVIAPSVHDEGDLCIRAVGSTDELPLRVWLDEFKGGVLALLTVEKVEEVPESQRRKSRSRLLRRSHL